MSERVDTRTRVGAVVPWFGAKRMLAPRIARELGRHSAYFEVFCGSLAVTMAKAPAAMETVNDKHGMLVNLARVIQHPTLGPALYRRCRRMMMCEDLYAEACDRYAAYGNVPAPATPDLDLAADFFYTSWVGRNGVQGTQSYNQGFAVRYTPGGGHGATRWRAAVDSLPAFRRRLSQVLVTNRCGLEMLESIRDKAGVAIYLDPPYVEKGAKYVHDFEDQDHRRMAAAAARFKAARVVISYYEHPMLRELYPDWTRVDCSMRKGLVNGNKQSDGVTVAPEILLVNGQSFTSGGLFECGDEAGIESGVQG